MAEIGPKGTRLFVDRPKHPMSSAEQILGQYILTIKFSRMLFRCEQSIEGAWRTGHVALLSPA